VIAAAKSAQVEEFINACRKAIRLSGERAPACPVGNATYCHRAGDFEKCATFAARRSHQRAGCGIRNPSARSLNAAMQGRTTSSLLTGWPL